MKLLIASLAFISVAAQAQVIGGFNPHDVSMNQRIKMYCEDSSGYVNDRCADYAVRQIMMEQIQFNDKQKSDLERRARLKAMMEYSASH